MRSVGTKIVRWIGSLEAIILVPIVFVSTFHTAIRISSILTEAVSFRLIVLTCAEISLTVLLLWATVSRWAARTSPLLFLAALRAAASLALGREVSYHRYPIPRAESTAALLFFLAGGILTLRYFSQEPRTWERVGLVAYIMLSLPIISRGGHVTFAIVSASLGLVSLATTWVLCGRK